MTSTSSDKAKISEALDYYGQAEKAASKGWFRQPDWDIAAQYYDKAGATFRTAKMGDRAGDAFKKASKAYFEGGSVYLAAKAMEHAAGVVEGQKGSEGEGSQLLSEASALYAAHGSPDRAAALLVKAGKLLEPTDPDGAILRMHEACQVFDDEDRGRFGMETARVTLATLLRHQRIQEARDHLQGRMSRWTGELASKGEQAKVILSWVILSLALKDEVGVRKAMESGGWIEKVSGFPGTPEFGLTHRLLEAWETFDEAAVQEFVMGPTVQFLENEVLRVAMTLPSSLEVPAPQQGHASELGGVGVAHLDEDEEGAFC
ncbi:soluble NSF attachment protein [Piptocephalis cylindrospora]|uniref:Gamma-soluble NSF attachment protein n=1 Tax=Piptocephalis cylindrospora TaxID=1907219 RepID=A0A4P9Y137_9FUNG|nr:soluble NSF attachment protein [Piptocephalis cylindrospora]|eukprot:RKP12467.1 soluble NSF attachment protein [Piptocephalis cylindrospora]